MNCAESCPPPAAPLSPGGRPHAKQPLHPTQHNDNVSMMNCVENGPTPLGSSSTAPAPYPPYPPSITTKYR